MITGDEESVAKKTANHLNINHYKAGILPTDKGIYIEKLLKKKRNVAMVGDGVNDAEALAKATVGIAMGSGTDIAIESAGITLIRSDLMQIPRAIAIAKATFRTIKINCFWAFIYNIIAIPIAAGILYPAYEFLLNPMIAGTAMAFSSLSVVSNSLLLKNRKI